MAENNRPQAWDPVDRRTRDFFLQVSTWERPRPRILALGTWIWMNEGPESAANASSPRGLRGEGARTPVRAGGSEEESVSQARRRSAGVGGVPASGNWSSGAAAGQPTLLPTQSSLSISSRKAKVLGNKAGLRRGSHPTACVAQPSSAAAHSGPSQSCPYSARVTFSALALRTPARRPWLSVSGFPN